MSELSETYHLLTNNQQEAIDLVKRANLPGFVYPQEGPWVALVADGMFLMPNRNLIEANQGTLLHYFAADDHGWGFEIYEGNEAKSRYMCRMEGEATIEDEEVNWDYLVDFVKKVVNHPDPLPELKSLLNPEIDLEIFGFQSCADNFAKVMGLSHFQWISYQELIMEFDPEAPDVTGMVKV